jgi:hypothetical protein
VGLIQFCLSAPKTDIENQVVVSEYSAMDRIRESFGDTYQISPDAQPRLEPKKGLTWGKWEETNWGCRMLYMEYCIRIIYSKLSTELDDPPLWTALGELPSPVNANGERLKQCFPAIQAFIQQRFPPDEDRWHYRATRVWEHPVWRKNSREAGNAWNWFFAMVGALGLATISRMLDLDSRGSKQQVNAKIIQAWCFADQHDCTPWEADRHLGLKIWSHEDYPSDHTAPRNPKEYNTHPRAHISE